MLIRRAELRNGGIADVRVEDGRIAAIGELVAARDEPVLDAAGALLLPGLHDHHLHVAATAAAMNSVRCGPPQVGGEAALAESLGAPGAGWLRGIGYHESVAGPIDRHWLDRAAPGRPVRVQHRSGRLWILNSAALDLLLGGGRAPPPGLERGADGWTGRLYDADAWLRDALAGAPPSFTSVGTLLARFGVTGLTDMTPSNDDAVAAHFARERRSGALPQKVVLAGCAGLGAAGSDEALTLGPLKLHLHEADLPAFDDMVTAIRAAHAAGRGVAVHCVTEVELVFTLAALGQAGARPGDRIEHASLAPPSALAEMRELGLSVVTQPNFVEERGDAYLRDIAPADLPNLYRLRSVAAAGIPLAAGTDAPFGDPDPWAAMAAAVSRRTAASDPLGPAEALTPEEALGLFLADPLDLARERAVASGAPADLCLLATPWRRARALSADLVRATLIDGALVHERVDQAPGERRARPDSPAR